MNELGMCDCTVDSDAGTGDFSLVMRTLHVWTHANAITQVSGYGCRMGLNYFLAKLKLRNC